MIKLVGRTLQQMPCLRFGAAVMGSLALGACASAEPSRMTAETSAPVAVDAAADNAHILKQLEPSLLVVVEIDGDRASLVEGRVLSVRSAGSPRREGELVTIRGLRDGELVGEAQVDDQRLNIEEGRGLVILEKRVLTAAVPMPQRIDTVEVVVPGVEGVSQLDVRSIVESFCRGYPNTRPCSTSLE